MKTASQPKVHVKQIKQIYASNRQRILTELELTELDYNNLLLTVGCEFVEQYHPLELMQERIKYDPAYWLWFRNEWSRWEALTLKFVDDNTGEYFSRVNFTYTYFCDEMLIMVSSVLTKKSFIHTYTITAE